MQTSETTRLHVCSDCETGYRVSPGWPCQKQTCELCGVTNVMVYPREIPSEELAKIGA